MVSDEVTDSSVRYTNTQLFTYNEQLTSSARSFSKTQIQFHMIFYGCCLLFPLEFIYYLGSLKVVSSEKSRAREKK